MTSELSDGGEIATGIAVLPSGNIPNLPTMSVDISMPHPQQMPLQQRLQPTPFMNWIPSHLPLQMDPNFDPNNMPHHNQVMTIPYPVPYQNQYFQSSAFPQNYPYQPFVTQLDTRYISVPAVNTLPSIQLPSQNTPHDIHTRSDSHLGHGPSPVNISLNLNMPHGNPPMFDFNIESLQYPHEYMNTQLHEEIDSVGHPAGVKPKRVPPSKKPLKAKAPPPKPPIKKQPRGKDDESVDKSNHHEVASEIVDDLVIFSAAQSEAVTQPSHIQEQLAKYKVSPPVQSNEPSPAAMYKTSHIKGPKVCCALGCEQVITKRRLCARHQKQKERNGGKISLKPEMEVGPTPIKRKKEEEASTPSPVAVDMSAAIKLDFTPSTPDKPNSSPPKAKKTSRKKTTPKKKVKQDMDESSQIAESANMDNNTRYGGGMANGFINNPSMYEANRSMLSQSGSLEDMFQSQDGTDVSEPHSDTSTDQLCDNYFKEIM